MLLGLASLHFVFDTSAVPVSRHVLQRELKPEVFQAAAEAAGFPVTMRMQDGYDHSYYFMATFMDEHVAHHAKALKA